MIRFALIPASLALAAALATAPTHAFNGTYTPTQYGPPIRYPDPRDWGPNERERRLPPPRRGYDLPPCIVSGQCAGPQPRMPPFPDRYDLYEGED